MRKLLSAAWACGAAVLLAVAGLGGAAQKGPGRPAPKELPYDRAIRKYLADRAAELERDVLPGIRSEAALEKARPGLRDEYFDMLGLRPLPERTPLKAAVTGRLEKDGYTVEELH